MLPPLPTGPIWLLDVNLPTALAAWLRRQGIDCDTAVSRGWRGLTNGLLAEAAFRAGFRTILTRDRLFGVTASSTLQSKPELAVVIVTLPKARAPAYLAEFERHWQQVPITPVAGAVIEWP